jgi:hypothetical protein
MVSGLDGVQGRCSESPTVRENGRRFVRVQSGPHGCQSNRRGRARRAGRRPGQVNESAVPTYLHRDGHETRCADHRGPGYDVQRSLRLRSNCIRRPRSSAGALRSALARGCCFRNSTGSSVRLVCVVGPSCEQPTSRRFPRSREGWRTARSRRPTRTGQRTGTSRVSAERVSKLMRVSGGGMEWNRPSPGCEATSGGLSKSGSRVRMSAGSSDPAPGLTARTDPPVAPCPVPWPCDR